MDIIRFDLSSLPEKEEGLALALGNFDGVHRGHERLFIESRLNAKGPSAALFLEPSFFALTHPEDNAVLTSIEDKIRYARLLGLEKVYVLSADKALYGLAPEEFIEKVLIPLGTRTVLVGEDFAFGKGAEGGLSLLRKHFEVIEVPFVLEEGKKISSRDIRECVKDGDVEKAFRLLGHPYEIEGKVVRGFHRGTGLGFPTLNLDLSAPYLLPKHGVYGGIAYLGSLPYKALINVGVSPTFGSLPKPRVEVHLLEYEGDAYGKLCYLDFLFFVREEKKFASIDELSKQIQSDLSQAKKRFEE